MNPTLRKFMVAFAVALLTIIITQEEILRLGLLQRLELASLDYRFQARGKHPAIPESSHVVIVEINDESFKSLPERWPWRRSYYAHLVRNLKAAGAKAVGIDVILNSPDAYSAKNDEELKAAIRETGIVALAGKMEAERETYHRYWANENFGNIFFHVDSALGLVNIRNDADGVFRRYSPYWERIYTRDSLTNDTIRIPTFSFAVLNKFLAYPSGTTATNFLEAFSYHENLIPKFDPSSILINFYGQSGTFHHIKFADVLDDSSFATNEERESGEQINTFSDPEFGYLHDGTFKDKIVLVGSTTPEDHDLFPVSIAKGEQHGDNLMYGVEIHANVIESVLRNEFLRQQSKLSEIVGIVLLSLLTFYVTSRLRSGRSKRHFIIEFFGFLFILLEIVAIGAAAIWFFTKNSVVIAAISPIVAVVGGYVASTAYHYVTERKQRLMIKNMFSTYVNPNVVDQLIAEPERLKLGGERKQLTALFSDIEGFTSLAEGMPPEQLVALLNEYLSVMTETVFEHDGTLDKFFGDAVIAFWGAPAPQEDHALRACMTALAIQKKLAHLQTKWESEGKPLINTRIGINTGEMIVGNMGGTGKFDYTVIGDSVNIASRLEGANKVFCTNIMMSHATYELVAPHVIARELALVTVKGRIEPLRVYELLTAKDDSNDEALPQFIARYTEGLQLYRERRWNGAIQLFGEALSYRSNDYPTQLYLQRAMQFKSHPPPEDWSGVFELTTK